MPQGVPTEVNVMPEVKTMETAEKKEDSASILRSPSYENADLKRSLEDGTKKEEEVNKDKKAQMGEAHHRGDQIKIGGTVYQRVMRHDELGFFGGGQVVVWTPKEKLLSEATTEGDGWVQMTLEGGSVGYAQWGDPTNTRWQLPDLSLAQCPAGVVKKLFKVKREWEKSERRTVQAVAAKVLEEYITSRGGVDGLTRVAKATMVKNIANKYMATSEGSKYDEKHERRLRHITAAEFDSFVIARRAEKMAERAIMQQETTMAMQAKLGRVGCVTQELVERIATTTTPGREQKEKKDEKGEESLPSPVSTFLPRARFLRNPYYAALLQNPSTRRSCTEPRLEATIFAASGLGEVRVLCAVVVYEGHEGPKQRIFAVARDWTGAFCLFLLEPFTDKTEAVVVAAYPLLSSVDMLVTSHQRVAFRVDGLDFVASFRDREQVRWLHDALKGAMASMYGEGNDDERIVRMRAYSVEFAAHYTSGRDFNVLELLINIFSVTNLSGVLMDDDFAELQNCLMVPQGRDKVVQEWLKSTEGFVSKGASFSTATLANHLRVVEELIQCPTPYIDFSFSRRMCERLGDLGSEIPEVTAKCSRLAVLLDYTDHVMLKWKSRKDVPNVPFDPCFEPKSGSQAAVYEASLLEERRTRGAKHRHSSGIYLVVLCFCGEKVYTDKNGEWIAELIQQEPTHEELRQLTADSEDYQWILRLGGADPNWAAAEKLQEWVNLYNDCGMKSFKACFIRSACRLQERKVFPRLGYVFDTPIIQEEVGSALILTISEVDSEAAILSSAGMWREICDLEYSKYTQSLMCSESARVAFLPSNYRRCVRYLHAAMLYQKSLSSFLTPGFYIGFFLVSVSAEGTLMLVPECNRNLPPLVKVSGERPSLVQWRWLQGLNYCREKTCTFGLPIPMDIFEPPDDDVPFKNKVGYAVAVLEAAVGLKVQRFYDLELFALDEGQTIHAFFAVAYYPPPLQGLRGAPEAPKGVVPMTFKLLRVVDDHHQRRYWGRVYGCLADEINVAYRKLCITSPLFTSDEAVRLNLENEAVSYAVDLDKYALLFSWARTLATWMETDGMTLVQKHAKQFLNTSVLLTKEEEDEEGEGEAMEEGKHRGMFLPMEEVVDIAVTNQAAATDPNLFVIKSLLLQLRSADQRNAVSILQRIQEVDDAMTEGYVGRIACSKEAIEGPVTLRSFDEVPVDDGPRATRPATLYELPCTLMEFVSGEADLAEAHIFVREIVDEVVELAVAGGAVAVLGHIMETMVSCVEASEDIVDGAAFETLRAGVEETVLTEREQFLKRWSQMFNAKLISPAFDEGLGNTVTESEPVFCAGSSLFIRSPSSGLRVCLARAASDANMLQDLLCVANSVLHGLELAQCLDTYKDVLLKSERVLYGVSNDDEEEYARGFEHVASLTAPTISTTSQLLTLISREQREIPLYLLDPFRCLFLRGERGHVVLKEFGYNELRVFGDHMNAPELEVAAQLRDLFPTDKGQLHRLLEMSLELQAPLLVLRLFSLVYGSVDGSFSEEDARTVQKRLTTGSFFFKYGLKDWLWMESLGGPAVINGFDLLWWLRYLQEAGEGEEAYTKYSGSWKQVYAETRVRVLLSRGVHHVSEEEAELWLKGFGLLVVYMNFGGQMSITDAEVSLLTSSFPMLRSLDLSDTSVTDESVRLLCTRCKRLVECSVKGCRVSREAAAQLKEICRRNAENL